MDSEKRYRVIESCFYCPYSQSFIDGTCSLMPEVESDLGEYYTKKVKSIHPKCPLPKLKEP